MTEAKYGLSAEQYERFQRLYNLQPKKSSPGDAAKAFKSLNPDDELLEKMCLAMDAQNRYHREKGTDIHFRKALGPWIRQYCWEDEIGSHAKLREEREQKTCHCGKPALYNGTCQEHFPDTMQNDRQKYAEDNGLLREQGESRQDFILRMQQKELLKY